MNQAKKFASNVDTQLSRWLGAISILIPILQRLNDVGVCQGFCVNFPEPNIHRRSFSLSPKWMES